MERFAWKARIMPGMLTEYIKRHDEIWPEMTAVLDQAGISNYTIWTDGNELFGYYECESVEIAAAIQANSPVVDRWNIYMKDVMVMAFDPQTGTAVQLKQVFRHEGLDPKA
jgi:L-rhamnose mutarotase